MFGRIELSCWRYHRRMSDLAPIIADLSTWLMEQGIRETSVRDVIDGLGRRLRNGGIEVDRISLGGMLLHPTYGAIELVWAHGEGVILDVKVPRTVMAGPGSRNSPFFNASSTNTPVTRYRLLGESQPYPQLEKYRDQGYADYLLFFRCYERGVARWAELPPNLEGVLISLATRRQAGFTEEEIAALTDLSLPLSLTVKAATSDELAQTVLDTYLGSWSGRKVLDGIVTLGDGEIIECVLWFCDLRDSTPLADRMDLDHYQELLNAYFDCTAGAVLDHGGEVLRFIGDAVMAVFPMDQSPADRALAAAKQAMARRDEINANRNGPPIRFGIALHAGRVLYANIGTPRRLEFSVIGPAANEVARMEGLCKRVGIPLLCSDAFRDLCTSELVCVGTHEAAGVAGGLSVYTTPEVRG